jgi:hypothetical protein
VLVLGEVETLGQDDGYHVVDWTVVGTQYEYTNQDRKRVPENYDIVVDEKTMMDKKSVHFNFVTAYSHYISGLDRAGFENLFGIQWKKFPGLALCTYGTGGNNTNKVVWEDNKKLKRDTFGWDVGFMIKNERPTGPQ